MPLQIGFDILMLRARIIGNCEMDFKKWVCFIVDKDFGEKLVKLFSHFKHSCFYKFILTQ
jgi:hypothetical protein